MRALDVLMTLRRSSTLVLSAAEAQAILGMKPHAASKCLQRLADANAITKLTHGLYWVSEQPVDMMVVSRFLTLPFPSYVSMYTALYFRGALSQMSPIMYCVTLGRARKVKTAGATFAFRHLTPNLFGGYETLPSGALIASTEKALFDLAYFAAVRGSQLGRLPELELPDNFDLRRLKKWISKVNSVPKRTQVPRTLNLWLDQAQ